MSNAERKELPTQNLTSSKNILQKLRGNQTFSDGGKLRELVTNKPTLKEHLKDALETEEKVSKKEH